jgi:GT2 family glycosyltransferase
MAGGDKKVLAVVVTRNRLGLLKECLAALKAQTAEADILVVDNASGDGTKEYLASVGGVTVISEKENTGGAGGFHDGMKYGAEHGYRFLWCMDDDTAPERDALEKLLLADGNLGGKYGFLASLVMFTDGKLCAMNNCLLPSKITSDCIERANGAAYLKILTATFVSFFVKTETVRRYGLPISEMFLWSDDTEFTSRIAKKEKGYLVPDSVAVHKMEKNEPSALETLSVDRLPRMVLNIRNRYYIARRDGFVKKLRFYARHFILFNRVLFGAGNHRSARLSVIFRGIARGWFFRPKVDYPENTAE